MNFLKALSQKFTSPLPSTKTAFLYLNSMFLINYRYFTGDLFRLTSQAVTIQVNLAMMIQKEPVAALSKEGSLRCF